jgi:ABC-type dipeptide/oligopeptide/nickel transport system ATPase subunit
MNAIQVLVMGATGSGKSAVEQEIVDALRNLGFAVKWDVKEEHGTEQKARKDGLERLNRIEMVSDIAAIVVKGVNVKKDINESLNYRVRNYTGKGEE